MIALRKIARFTAVLVLVLLAPGQIRLSGAQGTGGAGVMTGHMLMGLCESKYDVDAGICTGYITAVAESLLIQPTYAQRACGHDGVKPQQLVDTVKIEVGENPDMRRMPAGVMVAQIMAMSYPCYNDYAPAAGGSSYESESLRP